MTWIIIALIAIWILGWWYSLNDLGRNIVEEFTADILTSSEYSDLLISGSRRFSFPKHADKSENVRIYHGQWRPISQKSFNKGIELEFSVKKPESHLKSPPFYVYLEDSVHLEQVKKEIVRLEEKRKKKVTWFPYRMVIPERLKRHYHR